MRARLLVPQCLVVSLLVAATHLLTLDDGMAQRGQGKRWFAKNDPPPSSGILSSGVSKRKAQRQAELEAAQQQAAAQKSGAARSASTASQASSSPAKEQSAPEAASARKGSYRVVNGKVQVVKRTPGRRNAGHGPIKRRRTVSKPIFGN